MKRMACQAGGESPLTCEESSSENGGRNGKEGSVRTLSGGGKKDTAGSDEKGRTRERESLGKNKGKEPLSLKTDWGKGHGFKKHWKESRAPASGEY